MLGLKLGLGPTGLGLGLSGLDYITAYFQSPTIPILSIVTGQTNNYNYNYNNAI